MKIAAIIAEYNPFHHGHAYQIAATRAALDENCAIVCVMSGNFVQRGSAAVFDKWSRATAALQNGADLVLELPVPFAVSSAEYFARGAVQTLNATGIVDTLSFGSEWSSMNDLWKTARLFNGTAYQETLREYLRQGLSFAAARQKAADAHLGASAGCLSTPNSTLGVEYCKAILNTKSGMTPLLIDRRGISHDSAAVQGAFASASLIREMLFAGKNVLHFLPEGVSYINPHTLQHCERAVLARLRTMTPQAFEELPDCGDGLANRLWTAVQDSNGVEEILSRCKTKRYAHARLRRLLLWAFLGMTAKDRPSAPSYIRVLGFNELGRVLLRRMKSEASLPILIKPAHVKKWSDEARQLFELEARSTDLYHLCGEHVEPCGSEWKIKPIFYKN